MTVSYFALYRTPDDPEAFDRHYFGSHVPLIERTPGLLPTTWSPSWCSSRPRR
jgi:uncharacterized protein (TIGR02118 family)